MDKIDYSQPSFYHFSEDSTRLASYMANYLKEKSVHHLIDVCAGCGVIGIEIINSTRNIQMASFVEFQKEFISHLNWNLQNMLSQKIPYKVVNETLSSVSLELADVIVANPPYFDKDNGRLSPNLNKAIARHFLQDSKNDLFNFFERNLKNTGVAFFIAPSSWEEEVLGLGGKVLENFQEVKIYSWSPSGLKR